MCPRSQRGSREAIPLTLTQRNVDEMKIADMLETGSKGVGLPIRGLWWAWVMLIIAVTTLPWSNVQGHAHWDRVVWIPFQEVWATPRFLVNTLANVVLFVPFGYGYARTQAGKIMRTLLAVIGLAALLSVSVELFQVYCHNRFPSMTDVTANLLGTALGAMLAKRKRLVADQA